MANMRVDRHSGMVLFPPSKDQKEVQELKKALQEELLEMRSLKEQFKEELNRLRGE